MLSKRQLFRFCFPCHYAKSLWRNGESLLDEHYRLVATDELETGKAARQGDAELRLGWNEKGIALMLLVTGRKEPVWSRASQPEESDGLQLCLDTRDVRNVHRATRFCHRLILMPGGAGPKEEKATAIWVPIHRAKNHPNPVAVDRIAIHATIRPDGYRLDAMIPGDVLTGFEPAEHPRLGFHHVIADRELGNRYLAVAPPFPHDQDPGLWCTLLLTD